MKLIDTHQHLIYRARFGYGWTAGVPALAEGDYTVEDYDALAGPQGARNIFQMKCAGERPDYRDEGPRFVATLGNAGPDARPNRVLRPEADGLRRLLDRMRGPSASSLPAVFLHTEAGRALARRPPKGITRESAARPRLDMCINLAQLPLALELAMRAEARRWCSINCGGRYRRRRSRPGGRNISARPNAPRDLQAFRSDRGIAPRAADLASGRPLMPPCARRLRPTAALAATGRPRIRGRLTDGASNEEDPRGLVRGRGGRGRPRHCDAGLRGRLAGIGCPARHPRPR